MFFALLCYSLNNIKFKGDFLMLDFTTLTTALALTNFATVIQSVLPLVGIAVLVGFLFYVIRWAIGLFRGI